MDFVYLPNLVLPTGHNYYQPSFYNYDQPWTHGSAYEGIYFEFYTDFIR